MRKAGEIFRLSGECQKTNREIARSCGVSHTVVNDYLRIAKQSGLSASEMGSLGESELQKRLRGSAPAKATRPQPDWGKVYEELKKKSVTLALLWEEYRRIHPTGYRLSQFCELFRCWKKKLNVSLRQTHKAGEKMFVDYAGQTIPITDPATGEMRSAQIFVAVLGASNYTFSEATLDQGLASWTGFLYPCFRIFRSRA